VTNGCHSVAAVYNDVKNGCHSIATVYNDVKNGCHSIATVYNDVKNGCHSVAAAYVDAAANEAQHCNRDRHRCRKHGQGGAETHHMLNATGAARNNT
jgi:hypothetical protein